MAADWIKIEKATPRKPEVLRLAGMLGVHPEHAFGLCFLFWSWCDDHLTDCNARGVTKAMIDASLSCDGFAQAMIEVGWLAEANGEVSVPNFERHLSKSAKARALTAMRVAARRNKSNAASVTGGVTAALPEKRREEKINVVPSEQQPGPKRTPKFDPLAVAFPPSLDCPEFRKIWADWAAHRREKRQPLTPTSVRKQLSQCAEWGLARAIAAIDNTITMGWLGLKEPTKSGTLFQSPAQSEARQSELERRMARSMERLGLKPEGES